MSDTNQTEKTMPYLSSEDLIHLSQAKRSYHYTTIDTDTAPSSIDTSAISIFQLQSITDMRKAVDDFSKQWSVSQEFMDQHALTYDHMWQRIYLLQYRNQTSTNTLMDREQSIVFLFARTLNYDRYRVRQLDKAATFGNYELCLWLIQTKKLKPSQRTFQRALSSGHLGLCQYLSTRRNIKISKDCFVSAALSGNLDVLKWLYSQRGNLFDESCKVKTAEASAANGHFIIVKWLMDGHINTPSSNLINKAIESGHLKMTKWLIVNNAIAAKQEHLYKAIRRKDPAMFFQIVNHGALKTNDSVLNYAVKYDQIRIVKWLIEKQLLIADQQTLSNAVGETMKTYLTKAIEKNGDIINSAHVISI